MALLFAAGSSLAALLYAFTPSLSTIALSTAGTIAVDWTLQRYLKSSLGNYYYVYQLATGTAPAQVAEGAAESSGVLGTAWSFTKCTAKTGANVAYYGSKAALTAASTAASASLMAGKLLIMTVNQSGHVAYTLIKATAAPSQELFKYIAAQEPNCTLEDFYEWECVDVNISSQLNVSSDEEMKEMMSSWQLIQHKDEIYESTLLSDSVESEDIDSEWTVVDDDYLFTEDGDIPVDLSSSFEGFEPIL